MLHFHCTVAVVEFLFIQLLFICALFQWQSRPTWYPPRKCSQACFSPAWCRPAWPPCRTLWAALCRACLSPRAPPAWWPAWRQWLTAQPPSPWWSWRLCWQCLWWSWLIWWRVVWCSRRWSSPLKTTRRSPSRQRRQPSCRNTHACPQMS